MKKKTILLSIFLLFIFIIPSIVYADNEYKSGMYKVGVDIPSGEYILFAENGTGYFAVSIDSNQNDILFNDNFGYNSIVTVEEGEYFDLSRCYAVPFSDDINIDTSGTGMFKVGTHIPAGEYKLEAGSERGYYCIYSDSRHDDIVANDNFDGQTYVTVSKGQYLQLMECSILEYPVIEDVDENDNSNMNVKSLSEEDYIVSGAGLSNNTNLYSEMLNNGNDFQYFYYLADVDESKQSVVTINRGIHIGDTKEDVFHNYGIGKEFEFSESDILYNAFIANGDELSAQIMKSQCSYYVAYNWNSIGQIVFYFDKSDTLSWILYTIGIKYNSYANDPETVLRVQELLNEKGYDCGNPDGIAGSKTTDAIKRYQEDYGLDVSGIIDGILLDSLSRQENSKTSEEMNNCSDIESAYIEATSLDKSKLSIDSLCKYSYNGISINSDEVEWCESGAIYRSLAKKVEGFYVLGDALYGNYNDELFPCLFGIEKPSSYEEAEPYFDKVKSLIVSDDCKGIWMNFQNSATIEGTFDYENRVADFTINDLEMTAQELGVSSKMLGYILAIFDEYGAEVMFSGNSCCVKCNPFNK
ncbi:MAG: peptidoglycan-binding domain-containing protein [Blautia sp.]|nr:peptidoglycan-binding domain-containing protein [Blautia sp.]